MRLVIGLFLATTSLWSQGGISFNGPLLDPALKSHLELTDDQAAKILANNEALARRASERLQRIFTLSAEMAAELAKPSPDAMTVGTHSANMERACREDANLTKQTRDQNLGLLTEAQKTKLKALEETARLTSVIGEAQSANIYRPPFSVFGVSRGLVGGTGLIGAYPQFDFTGSTRLGCGFPGIIPFGRVTVVP